MLSRRGMIGGGAGLAVVLSAAPALAVTLDEAKSAGQVGEMPNGYIGVVQSGPGVQELVESVNVRRRAYYQEIADKEGAPLVAVEQRAGARLIDRATTGQYIMNASGSWVRK